MDIFNLLDSKFNLCKQVDGLNSMLFRESKLWNCSFYTFANVFEKRLLRSWPYSMGRISFEELLLDLGLYDHIVTRNVIKIETEWQALCCLQLDINVLLYAKNKKIFDDYSWDKEDFFDEVTQKYTYILDKSGLNLIKHPQENYYIIVPRDEKLKAIAEKTNEDTAFLLYEYTSPLLKGNYKEKRRILKLLANSIEPIMKVFNEKYSSGLIHEIFDDLSMALNNFEIRHTNTNPSMPNYYKEPLTRYSFEEWEEIYDTTYQLMLDAFLISNYTNIYSSVVKKHKSNIGLKK